MILSFPPGSSSCRASASGSGGGGGGGGGCGFNTQPRHTKDVKMVPVATLLGAKHYKASTGFSSPIKHILHN